MKKLIIWIVVIAAVGYGGSKLLLHHKVENGVDNVISALSPFAEISYTGVSSTMGGQLSVDGITVTLTKFNDTFSIGRLGIDTGSYFRLLSLTDVADNHMSPDDMVPDNFGFLAEDFRMAVDSDLMKYIYRMRNEVLKAEDSETPAARCAGKYGYSPETLVGLGYTEQVASMSAHFRRGNGKYTIDVHSTVDEMWNLDAEFALDGDMVSDLSRGAAFRPRMASMRVEYEDRSLNSRVRRYCERLGLSDEEILQAQMDALTFFGESNGIVFDEYVIEPYREFLQGKSRLVITAAPLEPVSLTQISLYKPSDVPALLDLSAEAF